MDAGSNKLVPSQGPPTGSVTNVFKEKRSKVTFSTLPLDAQAIILSFFTHRGLARFSEVSRTCRDVASGDLLWMPLLARVFSGIDASSVHRHAFGPMRQFRALAQTPCATCEEVLLVSITRFQRPRSCLKCDMLCCATHVCTCKCMDLVMNSNCDVPRHGNAADDGGRGGSYECGSCKGWAHAACGGIQPCDPCLQSYCIMCKVIDSCTACHQSFCEDCRLVFSCETCNRSFCEDCNHVGVCDICDRAFCGDCRSVDSCELCERSFCENCRPLFPCDVCSNWYCEGCQQHGCLYTLESFK
jgi:hypothetical protein